MKKSSFAIGVAAAALTMVAAVSGASAQSWTDNITVGGRMYLDVSSSSLEVNGAKSGSKNGFGFDVKRVYFQVDKKFNDIYSLQMQTDVSPVNQTSGSIAGQGLYLKKAYFKAAFDPAFEVSVGSNEMPWIPYAESIYGYRWLENTLLEQNNTGARSTFGTSADWGVHVAGKFAQNFAYQVSLVNGKGYRDSSRSEGMDVETRLSAKFDQWNFAVGSYTGKRGQQTYSGTTEVVAPHTAQRYNALAAFTGDRFKAGVEYFTATDWQTASILDTSADHAKADDSDGYSVFSSYRVSPMYTVFGRFDNVKPTKKLAPWNEGNYYNFGIQMSPLKGITLALVAKHDEFDAYAGGPALKGAKTNTKFNEIGIFSELRY
ncbi:hypothetical protein [Asticcacaulis sp. 201]|uniref:hypothetical protein n=1 Tax=Asticcacaulis sp. 201 TaxID=3028787 RepID=UPI00291702C0|nr:hypothetical protein [Asticcacaulis sp. 201]MDV6332210.1 hypothetical protein [Asticcacaulis sp. 201]